MFFRMFGEFLKDREIITDSELVALMEYKSHNRVKLGELAYSMGYLTKQQTEEINFYQYRVDKRFGDIAIEKGYLNNSEVAEILNMQGKPYHLFLQGIKELNIMGQKELEQQLEDFANENGFTEEEMIYLKDGDLELIAPSIIRTGSTPCDDLFLLVLRNIQRFISNDIGLAQPVRKHDYHTKHMGFQEITGPFPMIVGLCCENDELLTLASTYAKEKFEELDADSFDAVCEFINVIDGIFARKRSTEGLEITLMPPTYCDSLAITSDKDFYTMTISINAEPITVFAAFKNNNIQFKKI